MLARMVAQGNAPGADSEMAVDIAGVYAVKNDPDQAFKWLAFARPRLESQNVATPCKELKGPCKRLHSS